MAGSLRFHGAYPQMPKRGPADGIWVLEKWGVIFLNNFSQFGNGSKSSSAVARGGGVTLHPTTTANQIRIPKNRSNILYGQYFGSI
jgi:hypothetical protein